VAQNVDVAEGEGEGTAGRVGGGQAEGQASERRGVFVSEGVARGGGLEGRGGDWGVGSEPGVADNVARGADVGNSPGDVGLGGGEDGGDRVHGQEPDAVVVDRVGGGRAGGGGGGRRTGGAGEDVFGGRRGGEEGGSPDRGFGRAVGWAGVGQVVRAAADAAGVGGAWAAVAAGTRGLGAVGTVGAAAEAAEYIEDLVGGGGIRDGLVDGPSVGGGRRGRGGRRGGQESGGGRGIAGGRGRQGRGGRMPGGPVARSRLAWAASSCGLEWDAPETGGGEPFAEDGVEDLVGDNGGSVVSGWELGLEGR